MGGSGGKQDTSLRAFEACSESLDKRGGDVCELAVAGRDDEGEQRAQAAVETERPFLDGHVLVAQGVVALFDLEFAGEARDGVLVDADDVMRLFRQARFAVAQ
ncbi:MAG: hypothetical protein JNJ46_28455 [Myxococcales bacterium]|nr:hypothetical protein [Myxococcales bacterium]